MLVYHRRAKVGMILLTSRMRIIRGVFLEIPYRIPSPNCPKAKQGWGDHLVLNQEDSNFLVKGSCCERLGRG
jgi:hypothetical protein